MAEDGYAKSVLVTTEWLAEHLDDLGIVVAEVDYDGSWTDLGNVVDVPIEKGA